MAHQREEETLSLELKRENAHPVVFVEINLKQRDYLILLPSCKRKICFFTFSHFAVLGSFFTDFCFEYC